MSDPVVQQAPENTDPILVPYSYGIVAANKPLDSDYIEVTPLKDLPMIDGDLSDNGQGMSTKGADQMGSHYQTQANASNTIRAKWLKLGQGNRKTSPDVRRGAEVMIYRVADSDEYWWTTCGDDSDLRKLETVIFAFSGTQEEGAKTDEENSYYLEVSTHQKKVTFKTSQKNGEPVGYSFQLDTEAGTMTVMDTLNNFFHLNSQDYLWRCQNNNGAYWEINKDDINLSAPKNINMMAGENITMKAGKNLSTDAKEDSTFTSGKNSTTHATMIKEDAPAVRIAGNLSTEAGRGGSTGSGTLKGSFEVEGSLWARQDLTADGYVKGNQVESVLAFIGPNVS